MEDRIDKRLTTVEKDVSGLREDVKRTIQGRSPFYYDWVLGKL